MGRKIYKGFGLFSLSVLLLIILYGKLYSDLFCGGSVLVCVGIFGPYIYWIYIIAFLGLIFLIFSLRPLSLFIKRTFVQKQLSKNDLRKFLLYTILILLPSSIATGVKLHYIPFSFSHKIIDVDMWHTDYKVPRNYLEDWSLFPVLKGHKGFVSITETPKAEGEMPFVLFSVSAKTIDPDAKKDREIKILVSPKLGYEMNISPEDKRQIFFSSMRGMITVNHKPVYASASEIVQGMEMYRAESDIKSMSHDKAPRQLFYDIFIYKNDEGKIQNIARCTPEEFCDYKNQEVRSGNLEHGQSCERYCTDISDGTRKFKISYKFNKEYLDEYVSMHEKIINFVESFAHEKE